MNLLTLGSSKIASTARRFVVADVLPKKNGKNIIVSIIPFNARENIIRAVHQRGKFHPRTRYSRRFRPCRGNIRREWPAVGIEKVAVIRARAHRNLHLMNRRAKYALLFPTSMHGD